MDFWAGVLGCCIGVALGELFMEPLLDKISNWLKRKISEHKFKKDQK